MLASKLLEKDK